MEGPLLPRQRAISAKQQVGAHSGTRSVGACQSSRDRYLQWWLRSSRFRSSLSNHWLQIPEIGFKVLAWSTCGARRTCATHHCRISARS